MQSPPLPPHQSRPISPVAVNTVISSLITAAGVVLVIISGGFVMLASYIFRNALMIVPWRHEIKDELAFYMALAIIPSICAIITFIFGLRIVSKGLARLMQQGTWPPSASSKPVI
jgi:hypothetical protein